MDQTEFEQVMQTAQVMHDDIASQITEVKDIISESSDWSEREKACDALAGMREVMAEFREQLIPYLAHFDQLSAKADGIAEWAPAESQRAELRLLTSQFQEMMKLIEETLAISRQ